MYRGPRAMVTPTSATSEAGESYEDAPPAPAAPAGPSRRGPSRASISINNLPPEWKDLLGNFLDKDGDGRINTAEVRARVLHTEQNATPATPAPRGAGAAPRPRSNRRAVTGAAGVGAVGRRRWGAAA